jgi:hypothetical protein
VFFDANRDLNAAALLEAELLVLGVSSGLPFAVFGVFGSGCSANLAFRPVSRVGRGPASTELRTGVASSGGASSSVRVGAGVLHGFLVGEGLVSWVSGLRRAMCDGVLSLMELVRVCTSGCYLWGCTQIGCSVLVYMHL